MRGSEIEDICTPKSERVTIMNRRIGVGLEGFELGFKLGVLCLVIPASDICLESPPLWTIVHKTELHHNSAFTGEVHSLS